MKKGKIVASQTAGRLLVPLRLVFPHISLHRSCLSFPTKKPYKEPQLASAESFLCRRGLRGAAGAGGRGAGNLPASQPPRPLCSWRYPRAPRNPEPSLKSTELRQPPHFRLEETDVQRG